MIHIVNPPIAQKFNCHATKSLACVRYIEVHQSAVNVMGESTVPVRHPCPSQRSAS
jgi:hypothetical protein